MLTLQPWRCFFLFVFVVCLVFFVLFSFVVVVFFNAVDHFNVLNVKRNSPNIIQMEKKKSLEGIGFALHLHNILLTENSKIKSDFFHFIFFLL